MKVAESMHAGKKPVGVDRMSEDAGTLPECDAIH